MSEANLDVRLKEILFASPNIRMILEKATLLNLPNWYLAAGCVAQTVWNFLSDFDADHGIGDYDLVYYDAADISEETEKRYNQEAQRLFSALPRPVEIVNEARVHVWFAEHFGHPIAQYISAEEAIRTWSFVSSGIGVRYEHGDFIAFAPFGLEGLFEMKLERTGSTVFSSEDDQKKAAKWMRLWPKLKMVGQ